MTANGGDVMQATSIEWTDYSANPFKFRDDEGKIVWGCVKHSSGCANCYSETLAKRYGRGGTFTKETMRGLTPFVDEKELRSMLTYKPARDKMCFVGDMTDVFGEWVTDDMLDKLFAVFALRPDVTWQVLTKRPDQMAAYMTSIREGGAWNRSRGIDFKDGQFVECSGRMQAWPLPNVWIGTSVENQAAADERITHLLRVPAAVRFLSCEPLLGPVDLSRLMLGRCGSADGNCGDNSCRTRIDWVIVGGESGHGARPMHPDWARSLRDQCQAAGVPFFFKQWGEYVEWDGSQSPSPACRSEDGRMPYVRVGKKAAGRLLDGREWSEFPTVKAEVPA